MLLAYRLTNKNRSWIKLHNHGRLPLDEPTSYFVFGEEEEPTVVTADEFEELYLVLMPVNEILERYLVKAI